MSLLRLFRRQKTFLRPKGKQVVSFQEKEQVGTKMISGEVKWGKHTLMVSYCPGSLVAVSCSCGYKHVGRVEEIEGLEPIHLAMVRAFESDPGVVKKCKAARAAQLKEEEPLKVSA